MPSTLLRAEKLFRRFQRTVEAVDRKQSFPPPSVRQRKPASENPAAKVNGNGKIVATTGNDANVSGAGAGAAEAKEKVISPELRGLLSRKVEKLDKKTVVEHGGGVGG